MQDETPTTLMEAITYFSQGDNALNYLVGMRWPNGVCCPRCQCSEVRFITSRKIWECRKCETKKQFSVKVGTIMEDSLIPLPKWLAAFWLLANAKNGVSSYEIGRSLGVTQKSAWFMLQRIRLAMQAGTFLKFKGQVEVDETFIGGLARHMHKEERDRKIGKGTGSVGKQVVMGFLERHGKDGHSVVRPVHVGSQTRATLHGKVREHVETDSEVFTDALSAYSQLSPEFRHGFVDHAERYVDGQIHTNGLENFWALLKRGIKGTYVSVEPFHLFRYLDEQAFRFNNRKGTDEDRFVEAMQGITGKRVTYEKLTGKQEEAPA